MNKFQQEKRMIFSEHSFSQDKKYAVLEQLQPKKKNWMPLVAAFGVALIALFIWLNPNDTTVTTQAFTEKSLKQAFIDYHSPEADVPKVVHIQLKKFEKNDAIIITASQSEEGEAGYSIYYAIFEEQKWRFLGVSGIHPYEEVNRNPYNESYFSVGDKQLYVGAFHEEDVPDKVIVGNEEATIETIKDIPPFWIEKVLPGTPVFYRYKGAKERVVPFDVFEKNSLSVVQESDDDILFQAGDEMLGAYDSFSDYQVVIDPKAYEQGKPKPQSGDVVLIKNEDGQEVLTRIITSSEESNLVTIRQGTILINENFLLAPPYFIAHFGGNKNIYDNSEERKYTISSVSYAGQSGVSPQYFAKSDNWSSNRGFEGIIYLDEIIGKVKGYSLMTIPENFSVEVVKGYGDFKKNYDSEALKGYNPMTVALIQKYAEYVGDYQAVYKLYAKDSFTLTYDRWLSVANQTPTKAYKQRLLYEMDLIKKYGQFDEQEQVIKSVHPITKETKYKLGMQLEDDVWKVQYENVVYTNYN